MNVRSLLPLLLILGYSVVCRANTPGSSASATRDSSVGPAQTTAIASEEDGLLERSWASFWGEAVDPLKPRLLIYPTVAYAPETSWEAGLSALYIYRAGDSPKSRLSNMNLTVFATLEGQYGAWLAHNVFTEGGTWLIVGTLRAQSFPLLYHGIGGDSPATPIAKVQGETLSVQESVLWGITENLYLGPTAGLEVLHKPSFQWVEIAGTPPTGGRGSRNVLLGGSLMYNSIGNVLNPRGGAYVDATGQLAARTLGSTHSYRTLQLDTRWYQPTWGNQLLAFQLLARMSAGNVPFSQLSLLGGERLMRGYYLGRFRDRQLVAAQVEYRWLPIPGLKRLGAATFAGAGTVFPNLRASPQRLLVSAGLGLRWLLFSDQDVFTRIDGAITPEGLGTYLFLGEAF